MSEGKGNVEVAQAPAPSKQWTPEFHTVYIKTQYEKPMIATGQQFYKNTERLANRTRRPCASGGQEHERTSISSQQLADKMSIARKIGPRIDPPTSSTIPPSANRTYPCRLCPKKYKNLKALLRHIRQHPTPKGI